MDLPQRLRDSLSGKDYILQLILCGIGKKNFEEKYKNKLNKMKEEGKPIAMISFKYVDENKVET